MDVTIEVFSEAATAVFVAVVNALKMAKMTHCQPIKTVSHRYIAADEPAVFSPTATHYPSLSLACPARCRQWAKIFHDNIDLLAAWVVCQIH